MTTPTPSDSFASQNHGTLSDEEIDAIYDSLGRWRTAPLHNNHAFARAVIDADRTLRAGQSEPVAASSASPEPTDALAQKLIELADELDMELHGGAKWTGAQHTCASVSGAMRDVARRVDEQIFQLVRALREAIEAPVFMDLCAPSPPHSPAPVEPTADQIDAKRYRWLRDHSEPAICAFYLSVGQAFHKIKFARETVDKAIDAQIAALASIPTDGTKDIDHE